MRRALLSLAVLLLTVSVARAQVPRMVIAEDATATWCVYCPDAYAGLELMKHHYDSTEFESIRYYDTSGALGTAETHARISYYSVNAFPTVIFDGTNKVVGGGAAVANGSVYDPIVASEIGRPSPLKITINSVDLVQPAGSVDMDLSVVDNIASISNVKIRIAILENNVLYGSELETDVVRDLLPDVGLTVSTVGQVQHVSQSFTLDPTWKTSDLWLAVFVQDDTDKSILQSGSTRPVPAYSMRFWAKGPRGAVVSSNSAAYNFPDFAVYNLGTNPDVIHVALNPGTLPAGWSCVFTDGVNSYSGSTDVALNPGEGKTFHLQVTPGASGYAQPKIVLTTPNLPGTTREIPYDLVTNDLQVLVVDDDGGQTYDQLHGAALTAAGLTYGIWPTTVADITPQVLSNFHIVDWEIGLSYPTVTASDRAALSAYLDAGGKLFITGQDLGWEMDDEGGAALTWYHNYLHTNFVRDDTNINSVSGIAGDPLSDGLPAMSLTASLNPYPDELSPFDAAATPALNYTNTAYRAALKVDTGVYKVVNLGFGFEAITSASDRSLLMQRIMSWLQGVSGAPEDAGVIRPAFVQAYPNPAPGAASLRFSLPKNGPASLQIYAPDGALVRTLFHGNQAAGPATMTWDGRNDAGAEVPAGVYFYRLDAGMARPAGKLVLTR